jgi:hypothetical protein
MTGMVTIVGPDGVTASAFDATGAQIVGSGTKNAYNLAASTVVKATAGRLGKVSVSVAGAIGTVNDCATTGAAAIGNQIGIIPAAVGIYVFDWPCTTGIVYIPGAAQVASVSYA